MLFPHDVDVGLIIGAYVVNRSFVRTVEAMLVEGGRCGVVQDRVIENGDNEDGPENHRSLSRRKRKGDAEGKGEA
jgi:hypothetical protein